MQDPANGSRLMKGGWKRRHLATCRKGSRRCYNDNCMRKSKRVYKTSLTKCRKGYHKCRDNRCHKMRIVASRRLKNDSMVR